VAKTIYEARVGGNSPQSGFQSAVMRGDRFECRDWLVFEQGIGVDEWHKYVTRVEEAAHPRCHRCDAVQPDTGSVEEKRDQYAAEWEADLTGMTHKEATECLLAQGAKMIAMLEEVAKGEPYTVTLRGVREGAIPEEAAKPEEQWEFRIERYPPHWMRSTLWATGTEEECLRWLQDMWIPEKDRYKYMHKVAP